MIKERMVVDIEDMVDMYIDGQTENDVNGDNGDNGDKGDNDENDENDEN
jgi:hypothetical protein